MRAATIRGWETMTIASHGAIVIGAGGVGLSAAAAFPYLQRLFVSRWRCLDPARLRRCDAARSWPCRIAQPGYRGADRAARNAAQGARLADRPSGPAIGAPVVFPARPAVAAALDRVRAPPARAGDLGCDARVAPRVVGLLAGIVGTRAVSRPDPPGRPGAGVGRRRRHRHGWSVERQVRERHGIRATTHSLRTICARCSPASPAR